LFAGDVLLASQLNEMRKSVPASYRPLQGLMIAVLADALDCFVRLYDAYPRSQRGRLSAEARRWLFDDASDRPFSFEWVCDGLGLDASYLRAGIRRIEARLGKNIEASKGV
jgi:hypothetical protein